MRHERHKCHTSERMKKFGFDNDTSENTFSHLHISYMADERLEGEVQFHSKNYLLEIPRSSRKIRLKSAPNKLNFVMGKTISRRYTLLQLQMP